MQLRIGKRAQAQARRMEAWWSENRQDTRTLFLDELEAAFQHLCSTPDAGIRWPTSRRPHLRRMLLPRTNNHAYFVVEWATETVHVVALWGAPRGRTPKL